MVLRVFCASHWTFGDYSCGVFMRAEFWSKHEDVQLSERQKKVISRVLEEWPSGFEDGLTTRKYASIGNTSRATAFRET